MRRGDSFIVFLTDLRSISRLIANLETAIARSKQRLATLEVEVEDAKEKSGFVSAPFLPL